jgi:hypothetical protein
MKVLKCVGKLNPAILIFVHFRRCYDKNRRLVYKQDKSKLRECTKCGKMDWKTTRGLCE